MGSLPQNTILHDLQHGSFPQNCSSIGLFHGVQSFRNRQLQCGSPMRSQVLPQNLLLHGPLSIGHAPARNLLQLRLSMSCSCLQGVFTCSWVGSSTVYSVDVCSTVVFHGLQGDNYDLHQKMLSNPCSGACSTSSLSLLCQLGICRAFSLIFYHLSLRDAARHFLPFLKCVVTEVPLSLIGSALASGGSIRADWKWLCQTRGSSWCLLIEAVPAGPLLS